jgi:hypothetical protein
MDSLWVVITYRMGRHPAHFIVQKKGAAFGTPPRQVVL